MFAAIKHSLAVLSVTTLAVLMGCQTTPPTEARKQNLDDLANAEIKRFERIDSSLNLSSAYGYVIFPYVDEGAFIVGGAYGRGVVFEQGQKVGYADITKGTIGAQIGGQRTSELIIFENKQAMDNFKANELALAASVTATAITAGASRSAKFDQGVEVFVAPSGGLMAKAAVGGQKFTFVTNEQAERAMTASERQRSDNADNNVDVRTEHHDRVNDAAPGTHDNNHTEVKTETQTKEKI